MNEKASPGGFWNSELFFRRVVEGAHEGVWVIDADARTVYVNPRMAQMLGYRVKDMLRRPIGDFMGKAARETIEETLARRRQGVSEQYEFRFRRSDGSELCTLMEGNPLFDENGAYQGALAMATDITQRIALERSVRLRDEQLSNAEHLAHLGSWSWDVENDKVSWSDQLYRIYGMEPQSEIITFENYLGKVYPEDRERCMQLVQESLHTRKPFKYDERIYWPDGSTRHLVSRGNVILRADGSVDRMVGICMDITDRRRGEEQLDFLSHYDPVTGLINRYVLLERAEAAIDRGARHAEPVAFLLIDLDRFKHINDSLGHPVGDRLLNAIGMRIRHAVRISDTVSRVGGDEFVVMLDDIHDNSETAIVAEKILSAIAQPMVLDEHAFNTTASIGIVNFPKDGIDVPTLLKNADAAMYRAKQRGRAMYQFFSHDIGESAADVLRITSGLQQAAERNELFLVYQPQLRVDTGVLSGVEVLVRWRHPEMGLIEPLRFIPLAEDTGQIIELGRWVLDTACKQAMAWRANGLPEFRLAVNLSNRQLKDPGFVQMLRGVLRDSGFPPQDLELEITESATVHDYFAVNQMLRAVGELGVALAVDDFGTGYSSLSQLKQLPIDRVKVDRSFVDGVPADENELAMVGAIVAMAIQLGLSTTAEGVETQAQLDYLRSIGCEEVQGYLLARPLESDALLQALESTTDGLRLRAAVSASADRIRVSRDRDSS